MKKTLLTFTLLAGLSSCTNLSEDLDMIGTQNITQTKSGNLSISENEPAIVKDLRNYISQIKLQGKQARVLTSYTLTPYIYKEDTIMYIANYEDGWETHQLGTGDTMARMIIYGSRLAPIAIGYQIPLMTQNVIC